MESLLSAIVSSKQANLTAPVKSPSSNLDETREARDIIGSLGELLVVLYLGLVADGGGGVSLVPQLSVNHRGQGAALGSVRRNLKTPSTETEEAFPGGVVVLVDNGLQDRG